MKYAEMPMAMWALFHKSFTHQLTVTFGLSAQQAKAVEALAKPRYQAIIAKLPEFEKADRFKTNIVNCAMLCAYILNMPKRPEVEPLTRYYADAMMTPAAKWAFRQSGKAQYTPKRLAGMQAAADLRAADRNPYSWNMEFFPYADGSGFEARFSCCGICALTKELGLYDLTPAMCHLDYTMAEAGGATDFVRQYTLASGGPYCDCGYHKKQAPAKS